MHDEHIRTKGANINRIPLYRQIREFLLENIKSGTWSKDSPIPSENQLADQFNVSRITVRQAFNTLVEEGVIYRVQGKGSFISPERNGEPMVFPSRNGAQNQHENQRPPLIGYIAPRLNNMFMADILSAIEETAARNNYRLVFARTNDSQSAEEHMLSEFEALGVKGMIVYPVEGELYNEAFLRLILRRFPFVVIDRYLRGVESDCVGSDNVAAGRQAAEHLLGLGHTRIAFISHTLHGTSSVEDRLSGYQTALRSAGVLVSSDLCLLNLKTLSETNTADIRNFLERHADITAVIAVTSRIGKLILEVAAEMGKRIPEDLSLVLFDNQEPLAITPTYIKQQEKEIGQAAVDLLMEAMEDPAHKRTQVVFPTTLVVGKTSAPPRAKSPR